MITLENRFVSIRSAICFFVETSIILFSVVASFVWLHGRGGTAVVSMGDVVARALVITFVCQSCMYLLDLYNFRLFQTPGEMIFSLGIAIGAVCIGIGLLSHAIPKFGVATRMYYLSVLIASMALILWRLLFELYITRVAPRENILIVGTGDVARAVGEEVERSQRLGFRLVGYVQAQNSRDERGNPHPLHIVGGPADMERIIRNHGVSKVVVAITERRGEYPVKEMLSLRVTGCPILEWPGFFEKLSGRIPVDSLAPSFFIFNEGFRKSRVLLMIRRLTTMVLSALLLVLLIPLFGIVAVLIMLDSPGPVIYSQIRVGRHGKHIRIYKFRSMREDAEQNGDAVWAVENDPRITKIGSLLRKSRIDELPQLVNVFLGDLEFVGPRPERPEFVEKLQNLIPYYALRHTVKPGITGWAQVMFHYGSSIEESKEKLQYDLFYIKNMSLKLDLLILFHTLKIVILGRGAR